jgi:hypothetical protein
VRIMRSILLVRYAPKAAVSFKNTLSESLFLYVLTCAEKKPRLISSQSLVCMLRAYEETLHAVIPELPLEIALLDIYHGEKK